MESDDEDVENDDAGQEPGALDRFGLLTHTRTHYPFLPPDPPAPEDQQTEDDGDLGLGIGLHGFQQDGMPAWLGGRRGSMESVRITDESSRATGEQPVVSRPTLSPRATDERLPPGAAKPAPSHT